MRFPLEVARVVRAEVPQGTPLGARITGTDWVEGGLTADDAVVFGARAQGCGPRLCRTCPQAAITAEAQRAPTPGFNVPFAEKVKREVAIATRTVGLIATPKQAEAVVAEGKADMVALGRAFLDDPHWGWHAATALGAPVARPKQYLRADPKTWPGAAFRD